MWGRDFAQKPPVGMQLDWSNPLTNGLVWFVPFNEANGAPRELVTRVPLVVVGTSWGIGAIPQAGQGIVCNGTGAGLSATIPASVQVGYPQSLVCAFRWLGTNPTANSNIFCNTTASSGGTDAARLIWAAGNNTLSIRTNNIGSVSTGIALTSGLDYIVAVSYGTATQTAWIFTPTLGMQTFTNTATNTTAPSWTATATVSIGQQLGGTGRNSYIQFYWGGVISRAITVVDASAWASNPWQVFQPVQSMTRTFTWQPAASWCSMP